MIVDGNVASMKVRDMRRFSFEWRESITRIVKRVADNSEGNGIRSNRRSKKRAIFH